MSLGTRFPRSTNRGHLNQNCVPNERDLRCVIENAKTFNGISDRAKARGKAIFLVSKVKCE
jgi:hypothetical protein